MLVTVKRKSLVYKIIGFIRYLYVKCYYFNRVSFSGIGLFGRKVTFDVSGSVTIGNRFIVSDSVEVYSREKLSIGRSVMMNANSRVISLEEISIGNNVLIGQYVTILDHDHDFSLKNNELSFSGYKCASVKIGSNVWIGDKVTILKGVTIGDNVIIGANTVVTKSVFSNSIVAGNPAKKIRDLYE